MRQVVVLEPAGSVLVIRQHALAGAAAGCAGAAASNALEAAADHNQNRIVVVRSSAVPVRLHPPRAVLAGRARLVRRSCILDSAVLGSSVRSRGLSAPRPRLLLGAAAPRAVRLFIDARWIVCR